MMKQTIRVLLVIALLAVAGLFVPSDAAHAQPYFYRWGPALPGITCLTGGGGDITATFSSQPVEWDLPAVNEFSYIYDYNGVAVPDGPYPTGRSGVGSQVFAPLGSASLGTTYPVYFAVTLNTYVGGELVYTSILRGDCVSDGAGTTFITNQIVTPGAGEPAAEPLPGPDLVNLPSGSVVGAFVTSTPAYFAPQTGAATDTVLEAGKTLWVLGVDASGQFYRVVLAGKFFWVPVNSMGPNYDEVWQGTPLPTNVVQ